MIRVALPTTVHGSKLWYTRQCSANVTLAASMRSSWLSGSPSANRTNASYFIYSPSVLSREAQVSLLLSPPARLSLPATRAEPLIAPRDCEMACRCPGNGTQARCNLSLLVEAQDELHAANYFISQAWA